MAERMAEDYVSCHVRANEKDWLPRACTHAGCMVANRSVITLGKELAVIRAQLAGLNGGKY